MLRHCRQLGAFVPEYFLEIELREGGCRLGGGILRVSAFRAPTVHEYDSLPTGPESIADAVRLPGLSGCE